MFFSTRIVLENILLVLSKMTQIPTQIPETQIIQMLDSLIDNIFVECGGYIFQQTVGIPMGTNCAPLLDVFISVLVRSRVHSNYKWQ